MQTIDRAKMQQMLEGDATVVEVLSEDQYQDFHLPNAINVPLNDEFNEKIQQTVPDKSQPVVVYCHDTECTASPKAAERMEDLGYENVYDYEAGKVDWKEAGLPVVS